MKRRLKSLIQQSGVLQALARIGPRRAVLLRYHSVQPFPADFADTIGEGIIHSATGFAQQMEIVARQFHPVTLDHVVAWLNGERELPRRAVAITFDDGFADNYTIAAPILARHSLRAAFYVAVGSIGTRQYPWFCRLRHALFSTSVPHWTESSTGQVCDISNSAGRQSSFRAACRICATLTGERQEEFLDRMERELQTAEFPNGSALMMDWEQVVALQRNGHIIGSHTMTHPNVAHCALDEVRHELQESKRILEQQLATRISHFSYPSPILQPHFSDETTEVLAKGDYTSAVTCIPGPVRHQSDSLVLPRVSAPPDNDEFLWTLEASLAGRIV